jgi:hypothetical protein
MALQNAWLSRCFDSGPSWRMLDSGSSPSASLMCGPIWICSSVEGSIPLHQQCRRFWFQSHPQPKGRIPCAVHIGSRPKK